MPFQGVEDQYIRLFNRFKGLVHKTLNNISRDYNIDWDISSLHFGPLDTDKAIEKSSAIGSLQAGLEEQGSRLSSNYRYRLNRILASQIRDVQSLQSNARIEGVTQEGEVVFFKTDNGLNTKTNHGWTLTIGDVTYTAEEISKAWTAPLEKEEDWSS